MATRIVKPPAALEPRSPNERLVTWQEAAFSYDLLTYLSCFGGDVTKNVRGTVSEDVRSLPGTIVMRFYKKGETICEQDDPGFTAFYILKRCEIQKLVDLKKLAPFGTFDDWPPTAIASVRRRSPGKKSKQRNPVFMAEGEIFGEMSCLSRIPRTATVKAEHDCYILEFMNNVFKKGRFERKLGDTKVIERILELHLRYVELFDNLTDSEYLDIVAKLKQRLGLIAPNAGEKPSAPQNEEDYEFRQTRHHDSVVFAENDRPDGLYIIRLGMVKVIKHASPLVGKNDLVDWSIFEAALRAGANEEGGARHCLWKAIPTKCWEKLNMGRAAAAARQQADPMTPAIEWSAEQQEVLYAVNDLLKLRDFQERVQFKFDPANPLHLLMEEEAKTLEDGDTFDKVLRLHRFNRRLLEMILPSVLNPFGVTPPHTLAIRTGRDWVFAAEDHADFMTESSLIGEMGLFEEKPRSATCVVYCHPEAVKYGETDLYYIPKDIFDDLLDPNYVKEVMAARHHGTTSRLSLSVWQENANTQRFEELGLMQGQKLMLIDLDRCTRCDKCVEACVASHSSPGVVERLLHSCLPTSLLEWTPFHNSGPRDGRSRLFLDGPRIKVHQEVRIQNYLIPSTCRQCKDPVCLIDCPVGSIHKGHNGQIVIENWCIGCNGCAEKCPYNAIQMHMVGVIPRAIFGWRHRQANGPATLGATPFRDTQDLRTLYVCDGPIEFAYSFELSNSDIANSTTFLLHIESSATDVKVLINGASIKVKDLRQKYEKHRDIQWNWKSMLVLVGTNTNVPGKPPGTQDSPDNDLELQAILRPGLNEIIVQCSLPKSIGGDVLLDAGLTGIVKPVVPTMAAGDDVRQEYVMKKAVVCDMCGGQLGRQPACVTACPHEAAERKYVTYDSFLPANKK